MEPIIHIGNPKTGTTWFQKNFFPFVRNYYYIKDRKELHTKLLQPDIYAFDENDTKVFYSENYNSNIILSEEILSGSLRSNGQDTLWMARRLKAVFPNAKIVIFIRNQTERLASTYLYYLKENGGTYSAKKFINKEFNLPQKKGDLNLRHLEYHRLIKLYQELFGCENVYVFLYEEFAEKQLAFVRRFCNDLDLDVGDKQFDFDRVNAGLRKRLVPVARFCGLFYARPIIHKTVLLKLPFAEPLAKRMIGVLNKYSIFGERPSARELFGIKLYEGLCDFYKESNRHLLKTHGLTQIKEYGYPI